jgi:hypothetical protein
VVILLKKKTIFNIGFNAIKVKKIATTLNFVQLLICKVLEIAKPIPIVIMSFVE